MNTHPIWLVICLVCVTVLLETYCQGVAGQSNVCGDLSEEYVVVFPQNTEYTDGEVGWVAATPHHHTRLFITSPAHVGADRLSTTTDLYANQPEVFMAPASYRISGNTANNKAIRIISTSVFSLYAYSSEVNSCDGYLSLPVSALGTSYMPVCYWPPTIGSQITIAAVHDVTEVSLQFQTGRGVRVNFAGRIYEGGDVLLYTLDAYQVLQVQDTSDLTGTIIKSSRPVAVLSGNAGAYVQAFRRDQSYSALVEQMPPIEKWGISAYIVPFPDKPDTILKIVASVANTRAQYVFEGDSMEWVAQYPGDYEELQFSNSQKFVYIRADSPILVAQMASSEAMPRRQGSRTSAMTLVPTDSQLKNRYYFTVPSAPSVNNYLLVACTFASGGRLMLDGTELNLAAFTPYPTSTWRGLAMSIKPGVHVIYHTDPSVRFSAVLYGSSQETQCTYAHPAGICHDGPEFSNSILNSLPGFFGDTTTGMTATTGDTTQAGSTTDLYPYETTTIEPSCTCATVFLTGSSLLRELVGFYYLHTCLVEGRPVYVRDVSGLYMYYDVAEYGWVVSRGLRTGDVILRQHSRSVQIFSDDLFGRGAFWEIRSGGQWFQEHSVNVECVCNKRTCRRLRVVSRYVDHTFPGYFTLDVEVEKRPRYVNLEAGVILTFTSTQTCSYWAIRPLQGPGALLHAYDISPLPDDVKATWQVAKATGWEADPTLSVQCMDLNTFQDV